MFLFYRTVYWWAAMLNSRTANINTDPSCGQLLYYYIIKQIARSSFLLTSSQIWV